VSNVEVSQDVVHDTKGLHFSLRFLVKNTGQNVATNVTVGFKAYLEHYSPEDAKSAACEKAEKDTNNGGSVFPNETVSIQAEDFIEEDKIKSLMEKFEKYNHGIPGVANNCNSVCFLFKSVGVRYSYNSL
jgi:hypothetical protein